MSALFRANKLDVGNCYDQVKSFYFVGLFVVGLGADVIGQ